MMIQTAPPPVRSRILIQTRHPIPTILLILTVIHRPIQVPLPVRIQRQIQRILQIPIRHLTPVRHQDPVPLQNLTHPQNLILHLVRVLF